MTDKAPRSFSPGQRWISESEPDLGLGIVLEVGNGRVQIEFSATGETRLYAADTAPLRRVRYKEGDTITRYDGKQIVIESVTEDEEGITYHAGEINVPEDELSDNISFDGASDRLLAGITDSLRAFDIRQKTLVARNQRTRSAVRGLSGGRIDLIPHQLYIANEVSSRQAPRVLLSDEVGLGKTIEACLIVHRMLLTGRASRVLILVPDSLVHQWFVEMYRRFNFWFNIYDEERAEAIEGGAPGDNPFLDDQLVLASISFLVESKKRTKQVIEADWDILVVDEAHHLEWSPKKASPEYKLVDELSQRAEGLLLLTATPEQIGRESHFARLRLLDPDRYSSLKKFKSESEDYTVVAGLVERLQDDKPISSDDEKILQQLFEHDPDGINKRLAAIKERQGSAPDDGASVSAQTALLNEVLDLHGPGRVIFRNARASMTDFPVRMPQLVPLDPGEPTGRRKVTEHDPRMIWLVNTLKEMADEKFLLICRTRRDAINIEEALRKVMTVKASVFHEELTLVQRDRNAAWFAEPDGARLLICSEIGSEGRNFQFVRHLVLFDLPENPELLEQRIGRLDRIGQTRDIYIHVPYVLGTAGEVMARWYQEGLEAFQASSVAGPELMRLFGEAVKTLAEGFKGMPAAEREKQLTDLIKKTNKSRAKLTKELSMGRDRLLEMNSFREDEAQAIIDGIEAEDADGSLEAYLMAAFEYFRVEVADMGPRTYALKPGRANRDQFRTIPDDGVTITFDRTKALSREDIWFMTWDHPLVTEAIDQVVGTEKGNSSFGHLRAGRTPMLLEAMFVLETVADTRLNADRFLPPTLIRVVVDHEGTDVTEAHDAIKLAPANPDAILSNPGITQRILPAMLRAATEVAEASGKAVSAVSERHMEEALGREVDRLTALQKVNPNVRREEVLKAELVRDGMRRALAEARVRLDSVRLGALEVEE